MVISSAELLAVNGRLAASIPDFQPRLSQQLMAAKVETALAEQQQVILEAGTGTGKTFAYLIPALLSGKKILISTGTKHLQDQLYHRDLPRLRQSLGVPVMVSLLKGRANYLCRYRLQNASRQFSRFSHEMFKALQQVSAWAQETQIGDITELTGIPEEAPIWPLVTSTADNCLGQQCPFFNNCFLTQARRTAQIADIVVINHHLFFADMALRGEGFGELLPTAEAVIFDEAHQLPEIAGNFFGTQLSSRQLLELCRDIDQEQRSVGNLAGATQSSQQLQQAVAALRQALGPERRRDPWQVIAADPILQIAIIAVEQALQELQQVLEPIAVHSKGLESCWRRSITLCERFTQLTGLTPEGQIHWFETYTQAFSLNFTPTSIAQQFQALLQAQPRAWVFTSATLAVNQDFSYFASQLGLEQADCFTFASPFDYARQALLYLPTQLPEPQQPGFLEAMITAAIPVINVSCGRTFFLFTSHHALLQAAALLSPRLNYPLLIQGSMPKQRLLEEFNRLGNAVLLGTSSFWEGVDVRGEALSCVIIDKLPFAVPSDPLIRARSQFLKQQGLDPFNVYQIPQTVIALKQGVGRLIRDIRDTGVLMLCDPRLTNKAYGKLFLNSLPAIPRTRQFSDVQTFFAERR